MLCYHSKSEEWSLLSQITATLQGTEDAVDEAVTLGTWQEAWMPQLGSRHHVAPSQTAVTAEAAKAFWTEAKSLAKCLELQLEHQCNYHLFHQTLKDYEGSLEASFSTVRERLQGSYSSGNSGEAREILDSMQALITQVLLWWRRTDTLVAQSRSVLPMRARLEPAGFKRPGHLLVDYASPEARAKVNAEVFIIDSTNRDQWIVETVSGERFGVPALCVAISGPDPGAIERALALRLRLLANWTIALKDLGRGLISFLLAVFRQLNTDEVDPLSAVRSDGEDLQPLLTTMEQLLQSYWSDHPDFEELRERMRKARASLAVYGSEGHLDDCTHIDINTIFLRMSPLVMGSRGSSMDDTGTEALAVTTRQMVSLLMLKYQELAKYWEAYKLMTEASTDSNYYWMVGEFQQLRQVNLSELLE